MATLDSIIEALSRPEAYPHPVESVEVIQTHASVVSLGLDRVYELKKPVELGFIDYSTRERRAHYCQMEVELNRALAPGVYLGVATVQETDTGLKVGKDSKGSVVDHLVVMRGLNEAATMQDRLSRGE